MRRLAAALLPAVLLTACGGGGFSSLPKPPSTCEEQAYDDPAVKEIIIKRTSGNDALNIELLGPERDAINAAVRRCMQAKGLAPRGGVERVKQ